MTRPAAVAAVQTGLLPGFEVITGDRPDDDFYPTPTWLVRAMLAELGDDVAKGVATILDPGAGTGVLAREAEAWVAARVRQAPRVTVVEQCEARTASWDARWRAHLDDFFGFAWRARDCGLVYDLIITNPPFSLWDPWVEACFPLMAPGGVLLVLGHAGFLGGQDRAPWWRSHTPTTFWVSPKRPPYRNGDTDSRDAMWTMWGPGPAPIDRPRVGWLRTEAA